MNPQYRLLAVSGYKHILSVNGGFQAESRISKDACFNFTDFGFRPGADSGGKPTAPFFRVIFCRRRLFG